MVQVRSLSLARGDRPARRAARVRTRAACGCGGACLGQHRRGALPGFAGAAGRQRVFALRRAVGAWGKWNIDASRHEIEQLPAADYLSMSYYQRQFAAFIKLMVKRGVITQAEAESGKRTRGSPKAVPALTAAQVP